jgi:hypothetical protein
LEKIEGHLRTPGCADNQSGEAMTLANRVLLVDDHEVVRMTLTGVLEQSGFKVTCATDCGARSNVNADHVASTQLRPESSDIFSRRAFTSLPACRDALLRSRVPGTRQQSIDKAAVIQTRPKSTILW